MKQVTDLVQPRTLAGFRDTLPGVALTKEWVFGIVAAVCQRYGFVPIATPHLEYTEVLLGKGSEEINKQLYRFLDNGKRDVTLRFDHTVPLARFVVQHKERLGVPFKRYTIGNVFRGENTQEGRYREFTQCDFDYVGSYSLTADVEIVQIMAEAISAMGIDAFTIYLNNRKALTGICKYIGLNDRQIDPVLIWVDKLGKIGISQVKQGLMEEIGLSESAVEKLTQFISLRQTGTAAEFFEQVRPYQELNPLLTEGIEELKFVITLLEQLNLPSAKIRVDFSIARGLGYYTGIIYETLLDQLPQIGSICSGGRYDDLTKSFSTDNLPGVGASIGVDRLLAALTNLGLLTPRDTVADVLIANVDQALLGESMVFAQRLRNATLKVDVYPDKGKLGRQFSFADRRGHPFLMVFGENELTSETYTLSDLRSGEKFKDLPFNGLVTHILDSKKPTS